MQVSSLPFESVNENQILSANKSEERAIFLCVDLLWNLQSVIRHLIGWWEQLGLSDRSQDGYRCPGRCMLGNNCCGILVSVPVGCHNDTLPFPWPLGLLTSLKPILYLDPPFPMSLCLFHSSFPSSLAIPTGPRSLEKTQALTSLHREMLKIWSQFMHNYVSWNLALHAKLIFR